MAVTVRSFSGSEAHQYKNDLARLRIKVFREFPYLYDGSPEYEAQYLESFINSKNSIIVIAFDKDEVVGASTGMPLENEHAEIQQPWIENSQDVSKIFYFSESVLLPEYRGSGIGVKFFREREAWAKSLGQFDTIAFCAVVRQPDHPRKPVNYQTLDQFWKNRGYTMLENYICYLSWKDLDEDQESKKALQYWVKYI